MNDKKATYIAVVTGDLVDSSKRKGEDRKQLDELLKKGLDNVFSDVEDRNDIFRGDSFQIETNAVTVLRKVLKLRSYLKMNGVEARMAIGIGGVDYTAKNVKRSDGEAYQLSGEALDNLDKSEYLKIVTPWRDLNRILDTMVVLLDSHFINHSSLQAEAVYYALNYMHQSDIAAKLKISQPAVNNRLRGANFKAISDAIIYFQDEINLLFDAKGFKGVLAYYENAIKLDSKNTSYYNDFANILSNYFSDGERAIELYEKSLKLDPMNAETHSNYGQFQAINGDTAKAKLHYEKAIKIDSSKAEYYKNYGDLLMYTNPDNRDEARIYFEKALEINPNYKQAQYSYYILLKYYFFDEKLAEEFNQDFFELDQNSKKKGKN